MSLFPYPHPARKTLSARAADMKAALSHLDQAITQAMANVGTAMLRISLGVVFLWFGALKFFDHLSPAQDLAGRTIHALSGGWIESAASVPLLAGWECLIGFGLIVGRGIRGVLFLFYLQMLGTLTPIFLFPDEVFTRIPYAPTLEGQYIIKNIILISAGIVLGGSVRGGRIVSRPR